MKQIDWIEELEKKKQNGDKLVAHGFFWKDENSNLIYSTSDKKIYYQYAFSGASTPSYKVYYDYS